MRALLQRSGFLRTRFARRTLLTFLGAALLPSLVAGGIWFQRLKHTLELEVDASLDEAARSAGVAAMSRLDLLTARALPLAPDARFAAAQLRIADRRDGGEPQLLLAPRDTTAAGALIPLDERELWDGLDQRLDSDESGYCLFAEAPVRPLHCSPGMPAAVRERIAAQLDSATRSDAILTAASSDAVRVQRMDGWRVTSRELFLRAHYDAPSWRLVIARSEAPLVARLQSELRYFGLVGLLALVAAFTLSHVQLRRQTAPIETLQRATRAVREGRLDTRVTLRGDDEFTEFGETFNAMTRTLQQQVSLLGDVDALNERALRAGTEDDLVQDALARLGTRTDARLVSLALLDVSDATRLHYRTRLGGTRPATVHGVGSLTDPCRAMLTSTQPHVAHLDLLRHTSLVDPNIAAWQSPDVADVLIVPLRQDRDLFGAALVALGAGAAQDRVAIEAERRLAERLGLGLANARLVARLDALSLGTLRAFGSTIDANSRWTAGHSERVTQIAVQLGDQLGLTELDRLTLTRGCLLHDIGKVGIPASILDKSDRLTEAEFAIVQRHPVIGAEILGSIAAFRDLLPIVRSHHERADGRGYPDGLRGDEIPWLARIAAVADVFDALATPRPYRDGLPLDAVRGIITDGRGTHFDPRVVDALDTLLREGRLVLPSTPDPANLPTRPFADALTDATHLFPAIV